MSGDSEVESTTVVEPESNAEDSAVQQATIDSLKADIDKVININKELIASRDAAKVKTREAEAQLVQAAEQRQGVEGELDAMEQKFNDRLNGVLVDAALEKELASAGARNVDVAKKLLDKQNIEVVDGKADLTAIQTSIASLKENESYMFLGDAEIKETFDSLRTKPNATPVARAGEPENENIVNKELKATKTHKELLAVIEKHNIKQ